jgi:hypothetical protein
MVEVAREESHDDGYVLMRSPGPEPVAPSP